MRRPWGGYLITSFPHHPKRGAASLGWMAGLPPAMLVYVNTGGSRTFPRPFKAPPSAFPKSHPHFGRGLLGLIRGAG